MNSAVAEKLVKSLVRVGRYRELSNDAADSRSLPRIQDDICDSPDCNESLILQYLDAAEYYGLTGKIVFDALDPTDRTALFKNTKTDGTYLWSEDLAHYVRKYHLRLPAAFVEHMATRNWRPPK